MFLVNAISYKAVLLFEQNFSSDFGFVFLVSKTLINTGILQEVKGDLYENLF